MFFFTKYLWKFSKNWNFSEENGTLKIALYSKKYGFLKFKNFKFSKKSKKDQTDEAANGNDQEKWPEASCSQQNSTAELVLKVISKNS